MGTAIDKFLSLRCAGDVLESLQPLSGDLETRFAEAMTLVDAIRPLVLKNKGVFKIVELCAGRPIASAIIAHLLPVEYVTAFCWRGGPTNIPRIEIVHHMKCLSIDPRISLSAFEKAANGPNTIVIAGSPNPQVALHVAAHCGKHNIPMAMIPGYAHVKVGKIAAENALGYERCDKRLPVYLNYLGFVSKGKIKQLISPYFNDVLITRGL